MNNNDYLKLSERTEKKFDEGMEIKADDAVIFSVLLKTLKDTCEVLDKLKKHYIYDAPYPEELEYMFNTNGDDVVGVVLNKKEAELFHAGLGVITESEELGGKLLTDILECSDIDNVNMIEEIGDLAWYQNIMLRNLNKSYDDALQINFDKLYARYGEKFSEERALSRNLDNEYKILEGGV